MKKIFKYILISSALFSFAFSAWAQDEAPQAQVVGPYKHGGGVATSKSVTGPNEDGTYTITLETFAEGTTSVTHSSVPSDIILVLDISSSMNSQYYVYKGTRMRRIEALRLVVEDFATTIYDNAVDTRKEDPDYAGNRIAIVTYNRNAAMVTTGGWVDIESVVSKTGDSYSGTLISQIRGIDYNSGTRPDHGLEMAIDQLLDGSPSSARDEANLTVLMFTDGYPTDQAGSGLGDAGQTTQSVDHFDYPFASKTLYFGSKIKQDYGAKLYTIGLITSVDKPNNPDANGSWQWRNYCRVLQMMDWLSSNYPDAAFDESAITSLAIENGSYSGRTNSTVYTGDNVVRPWRNDWAYNSNGDVVTLADFVPGNKDSEGDYSTIVDDDTDFSAVFQAIADASGGSAEPIGTDTQVRDVLTSSFTIPDNVTSASDINLRYYTLDINPDGESWGTTQSTPEGITWEVKKVTSEVDGKEHNSLYVEGFEYSKADSPESLESNAADGNWVGGRYNNTTKQWYYAGKKLVIKFDIHPNGEATGGNGTSTNTGDSGVWVKQSDGTYKNVNDYDIPHTDLPVNIKIKKIGLRHGESATFEIWRIRPKRDEDGNIVYNALGKPQPAETTEPGEDEMYGWENWSKVILTNKGNNGAAVVKTLLALDPSWVYRVVEDDWGWAYTVEGTGEVQTTSTIEVNPFEFKNTEKTDVPKHAEAVTINHFKGTHNESSVEEYQSSKVQSW